MTALNPLAVANAALLRELLLVGDRRAANVSELARRLDRDVSNLRKTFKALAAEGLTTSTRMDDGLTHEGVDQIEAINRAEAGADEPGSPAPPSSSEAVGQPTSDMLALYHAQILPDAANARRDWDSAEAAEALDALREDLLLNGLLQNLIVRRAPAETPDPAALKQPSTASAAIAPQYILVGGERRWRAIAAAISDGDWPLDRLIPCRELDADDLSCRLAALAENIQRRNLNPIEKAQAFEGLAEVGLSNQQIAERIVATPEHVQQHRRFLQLDAADQARMTLPRDDPRHLSVRDARTKLARKGEDAAAPDLSPAARLVLGEIAHAARKADPKSWWVHVVVDASAVTDPAMAELAALDVANAEGPHYQTGEFKATIRYGGWAFAAQLFPWLKDGATEEDRDRGLCELQGIDLQGGPPSTYATVWLNGPFDLTEEGRAIVAQRAEEARLRDAAEAERQAMIQANYDRILAARDRTDALFAERHTATTPTVDDRLPEILTALGHRLPWTAGEMGGLFDADGQEVVDFRDWHSAASAEQGRALARLVALSVNAAAGLATPAVATPDPADDDTDEPEQDIDGNDPDAEPDPDEFADDSDDAA